MTLAYEPGESFAHRLDPRSKLLVQVAFAAAAFAHTTPQGLLVLTGVTGVVLVGARTDPRAALTEFRYLLPFLLMAPLLAGLTLGAPWFSLAEARFPALASYRVLLLLFVSAAYVRTTPVQDSRAAIQRTIPGKAGQLLGMGVAFVFRFFPVLRRDLARVRDANRARLGDERPLHERMQFVAIGGLNRAFARADTFSLALRSRCFAWNPTLPRLRFTRWDLPVLLFALALAISAAL
ncbi:energy-coupling factor transporter transmembrane component T family protein [Natronomonas sp. EA1]|uniref:energy-coupling factor transporter transmembrane component T family protein n=1 Tax=Natronomonas sp. EA1 TaxID=3421655 RepID=UPI003EBEE197